MANLIVENVRQEQTGVATGMNAVTRTLGGAFGGQLAATLLAGNLAADGLPTSQGFTLAFSMCLVAIIGALIVAVYVPRRRTVIQPAPAAGNPQQHARPERAAA